MKPSLRISILGSGTSTGVPVPGCKCLVCLSGDKHDKRLRASVLVEVLERNGLPGSDPSEIPTSEKNAVLASVLIDTSPDLRYQSLRHGITKIDTVLYTHAHADHTHGIDDLRGFNFTAGKAIPVYASDETKAFLLNAFGYAFSRDPNYEGGAAPELELRELRAFEPISIAGAEFLPIPLKHGRADVFGFRVGDFAYLTDCSSIPRKSGNRLANLDILVIDGLRNRPHKTHFTQTQAVREIELLRPNRSYLTHISHEILHEKANEKLRSASELQIELAYDGLVLWHQPRS